MSISLPSLALPPWPVCALLALALTGCSGDSTFYQDSEAAIDADDTAESGEDWDDEALTSLRLDIYPSASGVPVEPQTVFLSLDALDGGEIDLRPPVSVRGVVTGYAATPPSAIEVPGDDTAVVAEVRLEQQNGIADAGTTSDAGGNFRLNITPADGYVFSVVPLEPANLPFLVVNGLDIDQDLRLSSDLLDLGYGLPVYGTVTRSGSTPVSADVTLIDAETGVRGPSVETDASGYYQLRALPGTYELEVMGESGRGAPTVQLDLEVGDETGVSADVDLGDYTPISFDGEVVNSAGDGLSGVTARFTSVSLQDDSWKLNRETTTDQEGFVFTRLLPGLWHVEIIPDYTTTLSPVSLDIEVGTTDMVMDEPIILPELSLLTSRVLDPDGHPMSDVVVAATEKGFDGRTWTGISDAAGVISMSVPGVPLQIALTPPTDDAAVTLLTLKTPEDMPESVQLPLGQQIAGQLVVDSEGVPYAVIELRHPDSGALLGTALSNSDGEFSLRLQP